MDTIQIELMHSKALQLLQDLEAMHIIKMHKVVEQPKKQKLSEQYRGMLSKEEGIELNCHIDQMRNEWNNYPCT